MTVNVEWKTAEGGHTGLVADGTCLLDAARRHGIDLPAECGGRGECDTCAVVVEAGADLLSAPTEAERTRLGAERLGAGQRLACQAQAERGGDLALRLVPTAARAETTEETARDFKEEFKRLPLRQKIATLAGLEAEMAYETLVHVVDLPFQIMGKGLDLLAGRGRKVAQAERARRRPAATTPPPPPSSGSDSGHNGPAI
jgi:2Fe-2S ferredoxin